MSSVTGEIGFKIGAAGAQLPGINRPFNGQNNTALTVNGVPGTFALAITGAAEQNGAPGTGANIVSNGLLINAGNGNNDIVARIQGGNNSGGPGTSTFLNITAGAGGALGWSVSGTNIISWSNQGVVSFAAAQIFVNSANNLTTYAALGNGGLKIGNIAGGVPPVLIYAQGGTNTVQLSIGVTGGGGTAQGVVLGTSSLYAISTGTPYPVLQFAGIGAITGTGTIGLNIMAGGLYYNGTNYIYGQAGTGIVASLGTGSFTVSCFNTSGTAAGTATPTVVFSVSGTVTSNKIQCYGPTAAQLVDMTADTGAFNGTFSGMTTTINPACVWSKQGNHVMMYITPSALGTSNATTFTMTGVPTEIQPATAQIMPIASDFVENGGAVVTSAAVEISGGTVTFLNSGSASGWGSTLAKGFTSTLTIAWMLN